MYDELACRKLEAGECVEPFSRTPQRRDARHTLVKKLNDARNTLKKKLQQNQRLDLSETLTQRDNKAALFTAQKNR